MTILIVLVTIVLILDSALLSLLVMIQLPKKDAGAGVAFGGGATDALFGAGSGTALTNLTKYTAIAFFILLVVLSALTTRAGHSNAEELKRQLLKQSALPTSTVPAPTAPATSSTTPPATAAPAMPLMISSNAVTSTNTPK